MKGQAVSVKISQIRSFGLIVGTVFSVIGIWPLVFRGEGVHLLALVVSGFLVIPAIIYPRVLAPVYRSWIYVGAGLGWLNTRMILAIGYFLLFTPISWVMSLMGKDPLQRTFDPNRSTYRVVRESRPGIHMKKQF